MQHAKSFMRVICCGIAIGAVGLTAGCQQTGHQPSAGEQVVSSTSVPSSTGKATPAQIRAYTRDAMRAKPLADCNLETIGTTRFGAQSMPLKSGKKSSFAGWIDASGLNQPTLWLRFDDQSANRNFQLPVTLTVQRPDVASTHPGAPLVSGFDIDLSAGGLPYGKYHVYLAATAAKVAYLCDNGRSVIVAP